MSSEPGTGIGVIDTVDSRRVLGVSCAVAIVLGIECAANDISPTNAVGSDVVVVGLFVLLIAWAGASAPWWAITALGGIAAAFSGLQWWTAAAVATVVIGLWLRARQTSAPWVRSVSAGLAAMALMRSSVNPFFGSSALLVGVTWALFLAICVSRRSGEVRRRVGWGAAGVAIGSVLAVVGLGVGGLQAKDHLIAGRDHLTAGLDQLRVGDTREAAITLHQAAIELQQASDSIGAIYTQPSRLLPVVAHHRAALAGIVDNAARSALTAADALDVADIDQLQVVNGTIDVDALALLSQPLDALDDAVQSMTSVLRDANSPWLIGTVQHELANGLDEIDAAVVQSQAIAAAAVNGPAMLGRDGTRHYLIVFTSLGEARGQSGSIDNWAEISITDGKIQQTDFGRTAELTGDLTAPGDSDLDPSGLILDATPEYFARYGRFGAGTATSGVRPTFWSNVTMSPDVATVGSVMAQMYQAGGHRAVDGVFVIDATGLASLLRAAGPVTIDELGLEVNGDALEQFLLFDQYQLDEVTRLDRVEAVAGITLQQFLTATLPEPQQLAATLGPAATEGHITAWARRPEEEELFRLIGMAGRLPEPAGRDGLAVVTDNASGNKIDTFLERSDTYTATYDPHTGQVDGELVVTLHNTAPTSGYPDTVIGNSVGLPPGTNRTLLTAASPLGVQTVTIDDAPASVPITSGTELGWNTSTLLIDIPAGETRTVRFILDGTVATDGYAFVWRAQPLARSETVTVQVRSNDDTVADFSGELDRLTLIDSDGHRALR